MFGSRILSLVTLVGGICGMFGGSPALKAQPPAAAPVLSGLSQGGAQPGKAISLTLSGTNLDEPQGVWTSFPARIVIPLEGTNGRDKTRLRVQLEIPRDAPMGYHSLRLGTERGVSNFRLFCLDDLPEVVEAGNNNSRESAQQIPIPSVVVGKVDKEKSDYFRFKVKAGERVSFEVLGRRLGSVLDPQITLFESATGREVNGGHSNDAPGCQTDSRLTHTFKDAGEYVIEIRDVLYAGGADFNYRLRVGDFPCATTPMPMFLKRGTKAAVRFTGPTVEGTLPVEVTAPTDPAVGHLWLAPRGGNGLHGWPVLLGVSDMDEVVEQEPNNEPGKAMRLTIPCGLSGQFQTKGDIDHYVFAARKGQRYVIEAQTHELLSPAEVYLVLRDAKGGQVAVSNPDTPAARLDFTAMADGDYTLAVEHLHYWGGPTETYHLTLTAYQPSFDLTVAADRYSVAQGGTVNIPILCTRRDYPGPIEVTVMGPGGVTGQVVIPQGQPAKPNTPAATLTLKCTPDALVGVHAMTLLGKASIGGKPLIRVATSRPNVMQALGNLPYPPPQLESQLALNIASGAGFTLAATPATVPLAPGTKAKVKVAAMRKGYMGPIEVELRYLPAQVTAPKVIIPAGKESIDVELSAGPTAAVAPKVEVQAVGTAPMLGNQRHTTGVTLTIARK